MPSPENTYHFFWLLILLPIIFLVGWVLRWKKNTIKKLGQQNLVQRLMANYSQSRFLWKALLPLVSMALLALALVNFRKPDTSEKIKLTGTDVMIALDVSNSMLARDVQPNRLEKAKLLISKLIDQLNGNRVGFIVFAGSAYLQMPLTTDASAAKIFLNSISPEMIPVQGTNISEALLLADKSLNSEEKKYKSILLISDGEDHDADADATAKSLKEHGVLINTIGIGSPTGSQIFDPTTNDVKKDEQGNVVISKLNEKALQNLAAETGGNYTMLNNTEEAVKNEIAQLDGMEKKSISDSTFTNYQTYFYWFVLAAILFLLVEMFLSASKKISDKKTLNKKIIATIFAMAMLLPAISQKENKNISKGNDAYKKQQYPEAQKQYQTALQQNANNSTAAFNLGNTWYKTGKYDTATQLYDAIANAKPDKKLLAKTLYNKGVSLAKQKKIPEAVDAFKQSLKADPSDEETRENLQKALRELKQQPPPPQQNKQDKKNDKKKDDKQPPPPKDEKKKEKEQPQPQSKMTQKEAEQKLQALREEEKKLKQKLDQQKKSNTKKQEKDW